jgi:dTDP-4-dehydrorhamnose reductase
MRILITGAGGLLGGRLAERLARSFDVLAAWRTSPPPPHVASVRLDLLAEERLEELVRGAALDALVHCAALADVDRCELDPELGRRLNSDLPRSIARLCHAHRLRLVALSTDLVFDGQRAPYAEEAAAEPLLAYGHTKLSGEDAILAEHPGAAVARVALVAGRGHGPRGTATESIAWQLRAGRTVRLFSDQLRTPVDSESVADAVARLLVGTQAGRFHLGGAERLSRLEIGLRVARLLRLSEAGILPVRQVDQPVGALRPQDVSLASSRAERELGWRPRSLDEAILSGRPAPPSQLFRPGTRLI